MTDKKSIWIIAALFVLTGCGGPASEGEDQATEQESAAEKSEVQALAPSAVIAPGLSMRILKRGDGAAAEVGEIAVVHYTGWLYDEEAYNNRGAKFDSSVDRDQYFSFMLGAGRVIKGWDQGVVGMQVGETRELTIAPEMAYGDRGAGDVIPPGATLIFEVELAALQGTEPAASE